jgi:putative Mg2+ transporter-C (MgtC) family protein
MTSPEFTILQILTAAVLGGIIGIEREESKKPAGLRTHMLVSIGACLFTLSSTSFGMDPARIASGIVTGIGFLGAGCIIAHHDKVKGISTAASLWVTAAIGLLIGISTSSDGFIIPGFTALLTVFILHIGAIIKKYTRRF